MSYKGPHRKVLEHLRTEDGRVSGGRLECGHTVTLERKQRKAHPLMACPECVGAPGGWAGHKARAGGTPPPARKGHVAPPAEPPPRPDSGGAPAAAAGPSSWFREALSRTAGALQDLGHAVERLEAEVLAARPPATASATAPAVAAAPPRGSGTEWDSLVEARRKLEAVEPVRQAVRRLFATPRAQHLNPLEWEEALEAVERAARGAGWFDDAGAKSADPRVQAREQKAEERSRPGAGGRGPGAGGRGPGAGGRGPGAGGRGPGAGGRGPGGGEAGGHHRLPGHSPPGSGAGESGARTPRGRGPQKLTSPREA